MRLTSVLYGLIVVMVSVSLTGLIVTAQQPGVVTGFNPPTSAAPSGTAGGDLSGTYPNPAVASIGGKTVTLSGNFTTTGAFNPTFAIPASATYTFPSASSTLATLGANTYTGDQTVGSGAAYRWTNRAALFSGCVGCVAIGNSALSSYYVVNASAATFSSGFGTSPVVVGTAHIGSVNVGTGGIATSGIVAFAANPASTNHYCFVFDNTTPARNTVMTCTNTGTQITITTSVAWVASDIVEWITGEST